MFNPAAYTSFMLIAILSWVRRRDNSIGSSPARAGIKHTRVRATKIHLRQVSHFCEARTQRCCAVICLWEKAWKISVMHALAFDLVRGPLFIFSLTIFEC